MSRLFRLVFTFLVIALLATFALAIMLSNQRRLSSPLTSILATPSPTPATPVATSGPFVAESHCIGLCAPIHIKLSLDDTAPQVGQDLHFTYTVQGLTYIGLAVTVTLRSQSQWLQDVLHTLDVTPVPLTGVTLVADELVYVHDFMEGESVTRTFTLRSGYLTDPLAITIVAVTTPYNPQASTGGRLDVFMRSQPDGRLELSPAAFMSYVTIGPPVLETMLPPMISATPNLTSLPQKPPTRRVRPTIAPGPIPTPTPTWAGTATPWQPYVTVQP